MLSTLRSDVNMQISETCQQTMPTTDETDSSFLRAGTCQLQLLLNIQVMTFQLMAVQMK